MFGRASRRLERFVFAGLCWGVVAVVVVVGYLLIEGGVDFERVGV